MKAILVSLVILVVAPAFAKDDGYQCKPSASMPNGLDVSRLELSVSRDNPEATMSIVRGGTTQNEWLDYEGNDDQFLLTPTKSSLKIGMKRIRGNRYEATITHESIDTFSVLSCVKIDNVKVLDLTGRRFVDQMLNLYGDDFGTHEGAAVRLEGVLGRDFTISAKSEEQKSCTFKVLHTDGLESIVAIEADVEVDTGETCQYTFTKKSGAKALLGVFAEGT